MSIIDINCDLGEGDTVEACLAEAQVMPYISSCNIACGGHTGDEQTMKATLLMAKQHGVQVGAHPSYPDRENFGRQVIEITDDDLITSLSDQVEGLQKIAKELGMKLFHLKFHGALYNQVEQDLALAQTLAAWLKQYHPMLAIYGLAQGQFLRCCQRLGLTVIHEAFIDRAYQQNGLLVPRSQPGAVYDALSKMTTQACQLAKGKAIKSIDGKSLTVNAKTLCLHGDNPNALAVVQQLVAEFSKHNIAISGCANG